MECEHIDTDAHHVLIIDGSGNVYRKIEWIECTDCYKKFYLD